MANEDIRVGAKMIIRVTDNRTNEPGEADGRRVTITRTTPMFIYHHLNKFHRETLEGIVRRKHANFSFRLERKP